MLPFGLRPRGHAVERDAEGEDQQQPVVRVAHGVRHPGGGCAVYAVEAHRLGEGDALAHRLAAERDVARQPVGVTFDDAAVVHAGHEGHGVLGLHHETAPHLFAR